MQPVQLSPLPEQLPAPPNEMIHHLPAPQVQQAIAQLAQLIAKMATAQGEVTAGE